MEHGNRPRIRFPGFDDAWEQRKLSELATFSKGSGYSKGDLRDSGTPIILYGRLYTKYETVISEVDTFVDAKNRSVYSKGGEVIVPASGETAEDISIASVVEKSGILLGGDLNVITPSDKLDSAFLAISISNGKPHNDMAKMAQGKSVVHLHNSDLEKIDLPYPCYEEQLKITDCFAELDNLITLHQRKCDAIKTVKKCMLGKMFPKNGEQYPEIRFSGFSDAWEQRKLGDVIDDLYNGQTPSRFKEEYWRGDVSWLSSGELNRGHVNHSIEKITKAGQESAHLRLIPSGTFVMAITGLEAPGTRGNCAILDFETTLNQSCMALFPKKDMLTSEFLFQWYRKVGEDYGIRFTQGTKQQSYNAEIIKDLDICLPKVDEQKKISDYLENLDNLITLHQRKCDALKELKKALLQQMFI